MGTDPPPNDPMESREQVLADEARSYIRDHFASPDGCRTGEVADALGVSSSYLCHLYRQTFGRTVGEEIRYHRIRRARRLLRETDLLIKEVAAESGYLQASYRAFLNAFRAETGLPPSTYRDVVD